VHSYDGRRPDLLEMREYIYYPHGRRPDVIERTTLDEAHEHLIAYLVKPPTDRKYYIDDPWANQRLCERRRGDWYLEGAMSFFTIKSSGREMFYLTEKQKSACVTGSRCYLLGS
jgi:hypothetical protein